jgi:hypothetical protein
MLLEEGMVGSVVERKEGSANVERRCCGGSVDDYFGKDIPLLRWGDRRGGSCIGRLCYESLGVGLSCCVTATERKSSPDEKYEQVPHFVLKVAVSRQGKRGTCVRDVKSTDPRLVAWLAWLGKCRATKPEPSDRTHAPPYSTVCTALSLN